MSCGDLTGAFLRLSEHEAPATVTVPVNSKVKLEGKLEGAAGCVHEMTFYRTSGVPSSVGNNAPVVLDTWEQMESLIDNTPATLTMPATPQTVTVEVQGNHYAGSGGYPNGPVTVGQVTSATLTLNVVAAGTLSEAVADMDRPAAAVAGAEEAEAEATALPSSGIAGAEEAAGEATAGPASSTAGAE